MANAGATASASTLEESAEGTADKVVIFTTPACPYCRRAKSSFQSQDIAYKEVDVGGDAAVRKAVVEATGHRTVPVIFINGEYLGGADTLEEVATAGKLPSLLAAPAKELPEGIRLAMARSAEGGTKSEAARSASQLADPDGLKNLEGIAARMGARAADGGIPRESMRKGLTKVRDCFSGADAVAWILANVVDVKDKASAVDLGRQLQDAGLLHHATFSGPFTGNKEDLFRLHCDEPTNSKAFNAGTVWLKPTRPANVVAENLRTRILALYDAAVSPDGRSVKYTSLAKSPEFAEYVAATGELQRVDLFALSNPAEKAAFFINLYNSLVIHAMVDGGTPSSLLDRISFYRSSTYLVGGHDYSLDDIENGVLRGNRPPASSLTGARPFGRLDPRRFHALPEVDARIHFALNCGAKSCPPIKVYTAENLDEALRGAAEAFVEGDLDVDLEKGVVTVSKIFDWYKIDFGSTPEQRLAWIRQFVTGKKGEDVDKLLVNGKFVIEHSKYDWSLND